MTLPITALAPLLVLAPVTAAQDFEGPLQLGTDIGLPASIAAADVDGDGLRDLVAVGGGWPSIWREVRWFRNLGAGLFAAPIDFANSSSIGKSGVVVADFDGFGGPDVLAHSTGVGGLAWWPNANGLFGSPIPLGSSADVAHDVDAADLDGDGDLDLVGVTSDPGDGELFWYENTGSGLIGRFAARQTIDHSPASPGFVHAGDLDGDGDLDLVTAASDDESHGWYENLGAGTFGPRTVITTASGGHADFSVVDLDEDGDQDLLLTHWIGNVVSWQENLGGGATWAAHTIGTVLYDPYSAFADDLDGDGDLDVVSVTTFENALNVHENLGGATFAPPVSIGTALNHYGGRRAIAVDMDDDGDRDLVWGSSPEGLTWFQNASAAGTTFCAGDGSGEAACPCDNESALGSEAGCANSTGSGAALRGSGSTSLNADPANELALHVSDARPHQPAMLLQATARIALPFRDGVLCAGGLTERIERLTLDGSGSASTSSSIATEGHVLAPGTVRHYQAWYRDPNLSPCGTGSNFTNGVTIGWL